MFYNKILNEERANRGLVIIEAYVGLADHMDDVHPTIPLAFGHGNVRHRLGIK